MQKDKFLQYDTDSFWSAVYMSMELLSDVDPHCAHCLKGKMSRVTLKHVGKEHVATYSAGYRSLLSEAYKGHNDLMDIMPKGGHFFFNFAH